MTPQNGNSAVDLFDPVDELNLFVKNRLFKIVVYENSLDDIIGYVHSFDLFKNLRTSSSDSCRVCSRDYLHKDVLDLLTKKKRKSVAVVLMSTVVHQELLLSRILSKNFFGNRR
jgi:CBS domain containing-hemolysin-like protein